jgi:hypothetical protein
MKLNEKEVDSIDQIFSEHKERKIANDYRDLCKII